MLDPVPTQSVYARRPDRPQPTLSVVLVLVLFALFALPVILTGNTDGRAGYDMINYHQRVIHAFAQQWPTPDLNDYHSATTPGYHLTLAPLAALTDSITIWRLASALYTAGLLGLLAFWVGRRLQFVEAAAVTIPVAASLYVFVSGAYLLPDNAGWLGVLAMLLLALDHRPGWRTWVLGALALSLTVFMRQVHVWTAALLWTAAWLGTEEHPSPLRAWNPLKDLDRLLTGLSPRFGRVLLALLATVPAALILLTFIDLWGGLAPPTFQSAEVTGVHGGNPVTPAFILTELCLYSLFFVPYFAPGLFAQLKRAPGWVMLALLIGLGIGLYPESTQSVEDGRFGALWSVIARLPEITIVNDRSLAVVLGSGVGAVFLMGWLTVLNFRDRWVVIAAFAAFVTAQTTNANAWQRYHEPFVLILLAVMAASARKAPEPEPTPGMHQSAAAALTATRIAQPALLAVLLAGLTGYSIWRAGPANLIEIPLVSQCVVPEVEHAESAPPAADPADASEPSDGSESAPGTQTPAS